MNDDADVDDTATGDQGKKKTQQEIERVGKQRLI